jgi:hypothetical protein
VQEDGDEEHPAEPGGEDEAGADGDAVEEGVGGEAEEDGVAAALGEELVRVGLFAEVEVGDEGVFEQVDAAVAGEDEGRGPVGVDGEGFGQHLEQRRGEHEAGAQGDEVAQGSGGGRAADEEEAAEVVGEAGEEAEGEGEVEAGVGHLEICVSVRF